MFIRAKYGDTSPQNHSTGFLYHGFDIYLDGCREPLFMTTIVPSLNDGDEPVAVNLGKGIMQSYFKAYNSGDRNVYFIDGSAFFNGRPVVDLTVDTCHPNDEGMARLADYIGDVIAKVMKL